jgi:hypothetical protein
MPRAAIGVDGWIGDLGQRAMRLSAFVRGRLPVDRGADLRMAEGNPVAELQQTGELSQVHRVDGDAQPPRRAAHDGRVAHRLDRGDQEQPAHIRRQRREPTSEAVLDPLGETRAVQQAEAASQLGVSQSLRQLQ